MSRVTSKLQLTIPRAIALRFGIRPGDEVRWEVQARGALMIRPGDGDTAGGAGSVGEGGAFPGIAAPGARTAAGIRDPAERVAHFDRETARIEALLA
ncbi:MAG: AbrB/MazE/SpoVT family DNA-binding domain-containing protein, partial [Planctomycetaceae bacterium]|nr:AbrB/MazE/SpoVT family DNA-binding domain-containing protein [Planctomycetaceae bacterium]